MITSSELFPTLGDPPADSFVHRHVGPSASERAQLLQAVGYNSLDELMKAAIPAAIAESETAAALPDPISEPEMLAELRTIAARNRRSVPMIGLGYYNTHTPAVIVRNIIENPAWYTAYTPYQPEISQGRLEALLNFQTMITELTGMDVTGASMLDEPNAAAEAMMLARRATRASDDAAFVVDADVLPQTIAVLRTRAQPLGISILVTDLNNGLPDGEIFGVLAQYPGAGGGVVDHTAVIAAAHQRGALGIVAADLLAATLLRSPGEMGADVVVGSAQRFGVPLGFGGPHAGYLAVRTALTRLLPGRLVGVSRDADGAPAYRLALQTREQHIRRDKATSNICTAQVLLAIVAGAYAAWHGPQGLREIAERTHQHAVTLAEGLRAGGVELTQRSFFDTVVAHVPGRAAAVVSGAAQRGVTLRQVDEDHVGIACDETTTRAHLQVVWKAFGVPDVTPTAAIATALPARLRRTDAPLLHPIFDRYHSETAMMRYLRRLSDSDYALDRGMIPLGSCTMKLNAAAELAPISWPEFAEIHPFAPADQTAGYTQLIGDLESWLAELTGYDAVSVQPNAGSQGELAGLLAIRSYHRATQSASEPDRDVCLIPASAHGTNAATAVMAGMRVVMVGCDEAGNVDTADLDAKLTEHGSRLSALMVTYPSTHGVYEHAIDKICAAVHDAGGQVYVDGANLNALLGYARPGRFGADVSHINLHKTFCIPHGGGGPGVGPVAVRAHLAPYLPNHPLRTDAGPATGPGPVAGAPWGSAGILPISWAYIRMMGMQGLSVATGVAVLNANYVATRLGQHYPVLYTGDNGLVAHECILDLRPLTLATGVTAEDVAKRLIDYGFHAPTMSFPVPGTLMVEPTESEDLNELNRFVDAMVAIRGEIDDVAVGRWPLELSPLRNAPHTASMLTGSWPYPYDRQLAVFPDGVDPRAKYWPPVRRIDNAYGDRNVMCSCPPLSEFVETAAGDESLG